MSHVTCRKCHETQVKGQPAKRAGLLQHSLSTEMTNSVCVCMCHVQAMVEQECVGAIVCKLDMHKKMFRRGYIAMLAVDSKHRRKSIGENPVCARQTNARLAHLCVVVVQRNLCLQWTNQSLYKLDKRKHLSHVFSFAFASLCFKM